MRCKPLFMFLILSATLYPLAVPSFAEPVTLTLGRTTGGNLDKTYRRLISLADHLNQHLKDNGVTDCQLLLRKDIHNADLAEAMRNGDLDIVLESPLSALYLARKAGAVPLLLACREGTREYRSYIFTRADSGLTRLEDLRGKVIAFEDPSSTSSFLLPRNFLKQEGLDLVEVTSPESEVPPDKIGYTFAGSELNISSWVFFGKVHAGAFSNRDWTNGKDNPKNFRNDLRILATTRSVPRMLVIIRPDLPYGIREALKEVLLSMHLTPEGQLALAPLKIDYFFEPEQGNEILMRNLNSMLTSREEPH